jgi:hypothetical protein
MRGAALAKRAWQDPVWSKVIAVAIVSILALAVGPIRVWLTTALRAITSNSESVWFWLVLVTIATWILWIRVSRLRDRLAIGFVDDFSGDLGQKWDFVGPWKIIDRELIVTGSDQGGLTRAGALWEDYTLNFDAKIINRCLGVVVRAHDLDNYYMLQINMDRIRPHRRVAVPAIVANTVSSASPGSGSTLQIGYQVGWQVFEDQSRTLNNKRLDQWFHVSVSARGRALEMCIDGDKVFCEPSFLQHATGKIGFRNDGPEQAFVRNVRVSLDR